MTLDGQDESAQRRWDDLDKTMRQGRALLPDRVFIAEVTISIVEQRRTPGLIGVNVAKEVGQFVVEDPNREQALNGIVNEVMCWAEAVGRRKA